MTEQTDVPALAQAALARFGDRLDQRQRDHLIDLARELEAAAADLRAFELANGDESDATFSVIERQDT